VSKQVGHLGVLPEGERSPARVDALVDTVGAGERVGVARPRGVGIGFDLGGGERRRDLGADVATEVIGEREV
jgi:hypothetical protein